MAEEDEGGSGNKNTPTRNEQGYNGYDLPAITTSYSSTPRASGAHAF